MAFFSNDVTGGATAVNKSGYSSTIICGRNTAGEPFPPRLYLVPLVPNTTGMMQVTNQNYGYYKSIFHNNLHWLSQA
jgi:hypothetical protein